METNPSGTVSYTTEENNSRPYLYELLQDVSRYNSLIAFSKGGEYGEGDYKHFGTINTRYIPNRISLSNAKKEKNIHERKK